MKNWFSAFKSNYFDPDFDLRVQAFNLLAHAGMAAGIAAALVRPACSVHNSKR